MTHLPSARAHKSNPLPPTIAEAIGYRYLRGLEVIEGELARGKHLAKFRHERMEFKHAFELSADSAHTMTKNGPTSTAALEVVLMFQSELLALCPWLELVGNTLEAGLLREACKLEPQHRDQSA